MRLPSEKARTYTYSDYLSWPTVVQPDIAVICDLSKLDERDCNSVPDFIAESTYTFTASSKDHIRKVALYEKHGVREYWIIHPYDNIIHVSLLEDNERYGRIEVYDGKGHLAVKTLAGLEIDLDMLFRQLL